MDKPLLNNIKGELNYKELKLKEEKLNSEVENRGNYKAQRTWKIDKSEINMEVLNKIIAFKMLEIMRDHEMIDEREYAKIEKKRTQFGENVVKQNPTLTGCY